MDQPPLLKAMRMQPDGVLETCICVDDLDAAEAFYGGVLGLVRIERHPERHVFYRCGPGVFLIFVAEHSSLADSALPPHGTSGPGHAAFAVPGEDIELWKHHLAANHIEIEHEIDWPQGGRSIYFRDPAGNSIELAEPRIWQTEDNPPVK